MNIEDLPINLLVENCRHEIEQYYSRQKEAGFDNCFELWRRALAGRDDLAWGALYPLYLGQVRGWLRQNTRRWPTLHFDEAILINGAYYRVFRSITPQKFENFSSLARLLEYVKLCCASEVLDTVRQLEATREQVSLEVHETTNDTEEGFSPQSRLSSPDNVEESVTNELDRAPFWEIVERHLYNPAEKTAMYARYVLGLPPREIRESFPHYFADEKAVYRHIRNVTWRLKQDPRLKNWFEELKS